MTTITAAGTLLTADLDERTLTYSILPFGEVGHTNMGATTATAGTITLPDDPGTVTFNEEHDFTKPIGRATSIVETETGITATFKIAGTSRGDDILVEASEGLRTGASVEIDNPVIRQGNLKAGKLTAVAAVVRPAFPSAQLQMVAADCGELPTHQEDTMSDELTAATSEVATETKVSPPPTPSAAMTAAQAPAGIHAPSTKSAPGASLNEVTKMIAGLNAQAASPSQLKAALDQITQADAFDITNQDQWVDEVWSGRSHQRKFVPLLSNAALTSMTVTGWRFTAGNEPQVDDYTGFPAEPPTNEVTTEMVTTTAQRLAGAHAIDRIHRDFPSQSFWTGFFRAQANDYSIKSDAKAEGEIILGAGAPIAGGTVPTDVAKAAAYIVDGASQIQPYATPTFALVSSALYRELLLTKRNDVLEYLNMALGLEEGQVNNFKIVPSSTLAADQVLVGAREAITFYEMPGSPLRVDVESIATGGIENGVFGYWASLVNDPRALCLVEDSP